jgi:hypothetical protein
LVRTAAASTFNGGYAGSSNRRCLRFVFVFFLTFSILIKRLKRLNPSHSLTMPLFLLPATQSIFSFRNCSGVKSLILSHETLVKTTHREDKMRCHEIPLSPFQLFLDIFYRSDSCHLFLFQYACFEIWDLIKN